MSKKDKAKGPTPAAPQELKHSPFAALASKPTAVAPPVAPEAQGTTVSAPRPTPEPSKKSRGRLVLRRETKHRGGKAVIIVRGFEELREFDEAALQALARQLKQSLGCGGTVEHEGGRPEIVLQGDRAAKVAELLRGRGFRVDGVTS